ncbi:MAG: GNAT family N-acetyltransferase [Geminicoccaceae bacterium]|nr:GNAT family N-acetyltransferase [Geminicoccaceae bacterium]
MAAGAGILDADGFRLHRYAAPHPFFRSLALPRPTPSPAGARVEALLDASTRFGVAPRAEFTAELWPELPDALAAAGLKPETVARLMVREEDGVAPPPPAGVRFCLAGADTPLPRLQDFSAGLDRANGAAPGPSLAAEALALRRFLARAEGRLVLAFADGEVVAGAALAGRDAPELCAVWTAIAHRGRGLASAACRTLLEGVAAEGPVWTAAAPGAMGLYARLGFVPVGQRFAFG